MNRHSASVVVAVVVVNPVMPRGRDGDWKRSDQLHDAPLSTSACRKQKQHRKFECQIDCIPHACDHHAVMPATRLGKKPGHELNTCHVIEDSVLTYQTQQVRKAIQDRCSAMSYPDMTSRNPRKSETIYPANSRKSLSNLHCLSQASTALHSSFHIMRIYPSFLFS